MKARSTLAVLLVASMLSALTAATSLILAEERAGLFLPYITIQIPPAPLTTRVSVSSEGTEGNAGSGGGPISADGRFVVFTSGATNLVPGDYNGWADVFLHDRETGERTLVSVASDGTQGNYHSWGRAISADGRFVAFDSDASNLVEGDTNNAADVFVHDLETGQTTRVSVASDGTEGDGESGGASMSADGRLVAFQSSASNLVEGDTNQCGPFSDPCSDIFVHDRQTGETRRVSIASDGTEANGFSIYPSISADGRFVSFLSEASNLVADDTMNYDIFVRNLQPGQTRRVSVASDGGQANGSSWGPSYLSGDGRYVAFMSEASNLVEGDANGRADVFVHDRQTGKTILVSVSSEGMQSDRDSYLASISASGRSVAFTSNASNLVTGDAETCSTYSRGSLVVYNCSDAFVHDHWTGVTELISVSSNGSQGNENSHAGYLSAYGRFVTITSTASNLVEGDTNEFCDDGYDLWANCSDVFVHDRWPEVAPMAP